MGRVAARPEDEKARAGAQEPAPRIVCRRTVSVVWTGSGRRGPKGRRTSGKLFRRRAGLVGLGAPPQAISLRKATACSSWKGRFRRVRSSLEPLIACRHSDHLISTSITRTGLLPTFTASCVTLASR